ncbi:hypothetical protein K491DRAFT_685269 [Lophiostoma macrostomum CBS 122681]|uniref:Uncharacterized protein n=1 Tax=Lophiostoma macrostomum CBS 122681 TaxID=1314788 RepID=A0A6A6SJ26_9PLEO|nr:hypothetical protein K491DRAFT_685269 [Lophiostoma macrostomum CBS 122681]
MAMAIQKEHLGHAGINPQAILNHMEARCWTEPGQNTRSTSGFYNRGSQLFSRVKAARATKSDKTLATFLEQLNSAIMSSCRELRNEQAAELDAGTPYGPEDIQRAATPSSTTSSSTSSEDSEKSTDTPTEIEASLPDGVVLSPVFFVQDSRSPSNIRHSTTPSSTTSSRTSSEDSEESTVTPTVIETSLQDDVVPSPGLSVPTSRPLPQPLQTKQCDESSATGKSDQMKKTSGEQVISLLERGHSDPKDLDPFVVSGSKVLKGVGTYLVTSVGVNLSYGKILMAMRQDVEPTPL